MSTWEAFLGDKVKAICLEGGTVIDIGGGLRVTKEKGNRFDESRSWMLEYVKQVEYKIMDPVPDFAPDIVGDIHQMPFRDGSVDAVICIAVLEHVEDPIRAVKEMHRVLKGGGHALCYVPFLFYYHAEKGYYKDYWRFTEDAVRVLFKDFSELTVVPVRGAIETWVHLSPLGRIGLFRFMAGAMDRVTGKIMSKQVSGYNIFATK